MRFTPMEGVLVEGLDDWVYLGILVMLVSEFEFGFESPRAAHEAGALEEVREGVWRVVRELLEQGLVEIGDLVDGREGIYFSSWDLGTEETLDRLGQIWSAAREAGDISPGFGPQDGWFCNTPEGDGRARAILEAGREES